MTQRTPLFRRSIIVRPQDDQITASSGTGSVDYAVAAQRQVDAAKVAAALSAAHARMDRLVSHAA